MDAKITLSFDAEVVEAAKEYAEKQGISLSGLTEFLYRKVTRYSYRRIDDLPVSEWVSMVAEGPAEYKTLKRSRKNVSATYFKDEK
ncbi:DUF6364 family protein [Foetidibacter luteolus]|uniref:DUF6364 family protein n=1 Tax=Foetidibacter luteolus TaxID=2608880 RepID=UPI00129BF92E|nr:DUF6364 family protein [Foetidibacter luteolus]